MSDKIEAIANAVVGLAISYALVASLRALGLWDAHAVWVTLVFFTASVARSYGLRRMFRRIGSDR